MNEMDKEKYEDVNVFVKREGKWMLRRLVKGEMEKK